ncbi:MAG: hypothetical protein J3R72DRAFT_426999 [Linnemannia gamsii]|nr:MAG: hypothetical protein J3R72DRAFT_426999 [Linnemannia gamsii]
MMHSDDTQERSQGFRSVHKSQRPSTTAASPDADDIIFIVCHFGDNDSQQPIIFWEDIQQAFENALYVRVGTQKVSFLRGQDHKHQRSLWYNKEASGPEAVN